MKFYEFSQKEYEDLLAEESFEAGMEEGLKTGIEALIFDNLEEEVPEERILDKLMRRFSLNRDQAQRYLEELKTNQ